MITVLLRTLLIYFFLILFLKLMGKRQVGELEISELVTTLLLSEIAAIPIENNDIPLIHAAIPMFVIISLEIILSFSATKSEWLKRFLGGKPSILISKGVIDIDEMSKARLSAEELMSELRLKGIAELDDVNYAILEQNGQISVITKKNRSPLTPDDLNISKNDCGISHLLIVDGHIKYANLKAAGKSAQWLSDHLKKNNIFKEDIFLMTLNDSEQVKIICKKEQK
ncbi:MAG: DUF421 domain-containing protein [Clostridia bacterium]|nr:DUF421 domain-containing protein [Clostridia bacterium]